MSMSFLDAPLAPGLQELLESGPQRKGQLHFLGLARHQEHPVGKFEHAGIHLAAVRIAKIMVGAKAASQRDGPATLAGAKQLDLRPDPNPRLAHSRLPPGPARK